jgi:hypothetical protein
MVVHITEDLMMSSNASLAAREAGHKFKFVSSWDRARHFIEHNEVRFLIVDLQTTGLKLDELRQGLSQLDPDRCPRAFAYAQHVEVELLEQASAMPFEKVMTRGQAHHSLKELLKATT